MPTRAFVHSSFLTAVLTAGFTLGMLGCEGPPTPASGKQASPPADPSAAAPGPQVEGQVKQDQDVSKKESASSDEKQIKLEVLSVDDIVKQIEAQHGKIVVVDTWATWCVPCKKEFPGLVRLHEKHAKDGVVCMSVSVDKVTKQPEAKEFLQQVGAQFANYLTPSTPWGDKWGMKSIPVVLVFDREGKLTRKFDGDDPDNQFTYADVEKKVEELLHAAR
jgi:thiol-disulfide isomerase/thioredoxin